MKIDQDAIINVSQEVTKSDGSNDGIWFFGDKLEIGNELIIGFSPTNYHCFIICGDQEFHPRFSINPCKYQPSRVDNVRAALLIRIKNISKEDILNFQLYLSAMKDKRTPTCHQGLLKVLKRGIGLKIPNQSIFWTTPKSFLKGILGKGLVDKNNNEVFLEVYNTRNKSLKEIYFDLSIIRWKYAWVFSLSNIYFQILKIIKPQILVR
ncbi:MAG: hypothetical protein H7281_12115 [Bacteriovorax sp.]|nr:hypothetical protein [Bacteriovorax sp.]